MVLVGWVGMVGVVWLVVGWFTHPFNPPTEGGKRPLHSPPQAGAHGPPFVRGGYVLGENVLRSEYRGRGGEPAAPTAGVLLTVDEVDVRVRVGDAPRPTVGCGCAHIHARACTHADGRAWARVRVGLLSLTL